MKVKDLVEIASDETLFDIRKAGEGRTMFAGTGLKVYQNRDLIIKENNVLWELEVLAIKPVIVDEIAAQVAFTIIV